MNFKELLCVPDHTQVSQWVFYGPAEHPEMYQMYLRVGKTYLRQNFGRAVTLANISTNTPGTGTFNKLWPELEAMFFKAAPVIIIENIINPRFGAFFERQGFTRYVRAGEHEVTQQYVKYRS